MKKRAFTLVELLVLIAIIGVLVALTLPAIFAVQKQAQAAPAANNYRKIGHEWGEWTAWEFNHDGNKYLLIKGAGGGVCLIPALPPKAEKEPGHAE